MADQGDHQTPEAAACDGVPEQFSRTLATAVSPDGHHAFVLLGMDEPPRMYPYLVYCRRGAQGWSEGVSANGDLWVVTDDRHEQPLGALGVWGQVPDAAAAVTVRYGDTDHNLPVAHGYYLFAARDVPDDGAPPVVAGFVEPPA